MTNVSLLLLGQRLVAAAAMLTLGAPAALAGESTHRPSITGVWSVRVNITNCVPGSDPGSVVPGDIVVASFNAMNIFAKDGTFLDTNSQNPASQSAHFGYWRHLYGRKYEFAVKFFLFNPLGESTGWRIVRHDVVLSRGNLSFTSGGTAETYNNDGVLLPPPGQTEPGPGCSTSTATRFF